MKSKRASHVKIKHHLERNDEGSKELEQQCHSSAILPFVVRGLFS